MASAKTVKQIMETKMVTATLQDHIFEIAEKMKQHDIGFIPIVQGKQLVGVVTDRDLVLRGYAEKKSGSTLVQDVISDQHIVTVSPETSIDEASQLMAEHQVRRLPVVQQNELVGIIAIGDLAVRAAFENEAGEALGDISEKNKVTVGSQH
jgi:CBS domain-containing protein